MYHEVPHLVCFETFYVKCKENDLHRKYRLFGGLAENQSSTISQINKIDDFISFTKSWSRVPQSAFLKFLKNKI